MKYKLFKPHRSVSLVWVLLSFFPIREGDWYELTSGEPSRRIKAGGLSERN